MADDDRRVDGAKGAASDAELARRLDRLSRDLKAGRPQGGTADGPRRTDATGYAQATKLASEFVGGVIVGAALGWGLDHWAGTSPFGLIGFLLIGFCAGVLNVVRATSQTGSGSGGPL
jgi:ATP synthase protein I